MDLGLLETPGTKQVTKSKKRRSVRIRRKSHIHGLGPVSDEDKADGICLVDNDIQDVDIASMTSDVGKPSEAKNLQVSQNQYGSVWMNTDSPEMAELVMRRNRRKSNVHFPIMSVIDGLESPGVLNELEPELSEQHLSMELSRTGDMNNSPETNGTRLSGSYIVPQRQSPLPWQENDCSSAHNSEYLPSDNSTASLSPCFEASDYNIGRAFKHLNSTPQHDHNSFGARKIDSANVAQESKIMLSPVDRALPGSTQHFTSSCMTPVDKRRQLLSDSTSNSTPYSPSQPIFKNISPPDCESPNSTFSPIYLTPADKITRSNVGVDADDDDEDIWKTCKKTIVSDIDGNVDKTPGAGRKLKTLVSTQKKLSKSKSNSSTKVLSKEQTSGFLSICRSLAGKLAHAVRNSPDSDRSNQMSSSDNSFTSIKPGSALTNSSETAAAIVKSTEKNLGAVVSSRSGHSSDTCTGVVTTGNSNIVSFGEAENVSSNILSEKKSCQNLDRPDSIKNASSLSVITLNKEDGVNSFMCENVELERPAHVHNSEHSPVQNIDCEKLAKTSDAYANQKFCSSTDTTDETVKSKSYSKSEIVGVAEVSNRQTMITSLQSDTPGCSGEVITQHLEVCFDYIDPKPVQVANITDLASQPGKQQEVNSISLGSSSPQIGTDPIDTSITPKQEPDSVRMVKTKHTRTGRKSTGLVSHESARCELSESVNKLSLNTVSDIDTCSTDDCVESGSKPKKSKSSDNDALRKAVFTSSGTEVKKRHPRKSLGNSLAQQSLVSMNVGITDASTSGEANACPLKIVTVVASSLENVSNEVMSTVSVEPFPACVENKHVSTLPSVRKVKNKGSSQKTVSSKITSGMCSASVSTRVSNESDLPSVNVARKRGRPRKSTNFIPPVVVEEMSDINLSAQSGDEVQKSSTLHQFNNKSVNSKDSTDMQNNISESKQKSADSIKVLTAEDLKSLDEYLGIEEPEPVVNPPPKKRGRPRKSVDGQKLTKQTKVYVDSITTSADEISGKTENTLAFTMENEPEKDIGKKEDSRKMDVQTIVKDTLVAELEDLELLERPKRKSSRIQRRSIEIYRQIQNDNATEDVPMSPLEMEESKSTTAVLQDVSDNHGNTQNNQDSKTKIARKRKLIKNEPTVEEIYKNKNFKRPAPKIWETIYEAPSDEQVYSKKRYRRSIMFDESLLVPPAKTKMRLRRAIRNGLDPRQRRKKMLPDVAVKKKLATIEAILEDNN
ncbi:uncharacterized protein LOC117333455 [Pecten maximus]|uniref:uncharacterized protein LOC117333455 n=1 Tax=Pecten maximus TaxID=6579 RepID=UPI00145815ED|nr:uncharacterized protein LOC117333455 [Pecten maximus]